MFVCVCFVLLLPHSINLASHIATVKADNNKLGGRGSNTDALTNAEIVDASLTAGFDIITVCHRGDVL